MCMPCPGAVGNKAAPFQNAAAGVLKGALPICALCGTLLQLSLASKLAPGRSRSVKINVVYVGASAAACLAVRYDGHDAAAWALPAIFPAAFVLTRAIRAVDLAFGSAMNAAHWLDLTTHHHAHKFAGLMLTGVVLFAASQGCAMRTRLAMLFVCEACRLGLLVLAVCKTQAICNRRERQEQALLDALFGAATVAVGAAIVGVFEGTLSPECLMLATL